MAIWLKDSARVGSMVLLASWLDTLRVAVRLADMEAIESIRIEMIRLVIEMYGYRDNVDYAVSRYNDVVNGVDWIETQEEVDRVRAGL